MARPLAEEQYGQFSARVCSRTIADAQPTRVQFELTYRCNIHCVHCYTDPFNTLDAVGRELDLHEISRIFDELADAGVLWMTMTGGEALVHPQFRRIYQEAKRRGFIISLYSNGTTVSESLADFLAADPPFTIDVSCHAATSGTFDRITQVSGSFNLFQQGVGRLMARALPLTIKTKAMTTNRHELSRIKTLVEDLGLDFHVFTTIHPRLNGDLTSTHYRLTPREIIDLEVGETADGCEGVCGSRDRAGANTLTEPPSDDRLFRCGCGTNTCTINPYGVLRACTHTTWPSIDLNTTPFAQAFARLVNQVRNARYTGASPCAACTAHVFCHKNPAMAVHEAGAMEAPVTHYCEVAFGKAARLGQTCK
ncbi:MAG: hypothetical protein A3H97_01190 [Acidobacteria bacterium RIFCSPLOWO2_02_FULL_65_29]|nr:MAG: hypothetical protein A3H97_01190 [Acidobacteria bacterium RIFCSPLOWO2_02_FULL_65_29]